MRRRAEHGRLPARDGAPARGSPAGCLLRRCMPALVAAYPRATALNVPLGAPPPPTHPPTQASAPVSCMW